MQTRLEPDLFIVFMGNNEVVGPYGPGTGFGKFTPSLTLIRISLIVRETAIGQLFQKFNERSSPFQKWEGMAMFVDNKIHPGDKRIEGVNEHFRANLEAISRAGKRSGATVVLCTVPVNLKNCAPFASMHSDSWGPEKADWDQAYATGISLQASGNYEGAILAYEEARKIDNGFAELHFRLGQCYLALNQRDQAALAFSHARESDALRFRCSESLNHVTRNVATSLDVALVDTDKLLNSQSPDKICGNEFFLEHVHLTFEGNYAVASSLYPAVAEILSAEKVTQTEVPMTVEDLRAALPFTEFDEHLIRTQIRLLMEQPPFPNQLGHLSDAQRRLNEWKEFEENRFVDAALQAVETYQVAYKSRPDDWILQRDFAELLSVLKRFDKAAILIQKTRERFPFYPAFDEWQKKNLMRMAELVSLHIAMHEPQRAVETFDEMLDVAELAGFSEALSNLREQKGLYENSGDIGVLKIDNQNLFSTE